MPTIELPPILERPAPSAGSFSIVGALQTNGHRHLSLAAGILAVPEAELDVATVSDSLRAVEKTYAILTELRDTLAARD